MAGPYSGKSCSIYIPKIETGYSSTTFTGEAMTQVGSTLVYYITDRTKMVWNPDNTVTVYDGGAEITTGVVIDYACGRVTLAVTPSGAVTATGKYFSKEIMVGGFGWNARKSGSKHDVTTYEHVGDTLAYRSYVGGLVESTGSIRRHWYYVPATFVDPIATPNASLTWTWNGKSVEGNDEAIVYSGGAGPLEVTRAANVTTVSFVTATTTAAQIKAHVEADATLTALWTLTYTSGDGSGVVGNVSHTHCSGGRDSSQMMSKVGQKVPLILYLDSSSATGERLCGVANLDNFGIEVPVDGVVDSPLDFTVDGGLVYVDY